MTDPNALRNLAKQTPVDTLVNAVVDHVTQHSHDIRGLMDAAGSFASTWDLTSVHSQLDGRVKNLQLALDVLSATTGQPAFPVDQFLSKLNNTQLNILDQLNEKADVDELHRACQSMQHTIDSKSEEFERNGAKRNEVDQLRAAQKESLCALRAVQAALQTKLDRVELSALESAVERIVSWQSVTDRICSNIEQLESQRIDDRKRIDCHQESIERLSVQMQKMTEAMAKTCHEDDLQDLAGRVHELHQTKEDRTTVNEISKHLFETTVTLEHVQTGMEDVQKHETEMEEWKSTHAATKEELNTKAGREETEARLINLESDLQRKAALVDVALLSGRVDGVQEQQSLLERSVAVATRFIDWFSKRGEAYEGNVDVLERQLRKLSSDSVAQHQQRQPFERGSGMHNSRSAAD